jgi:hypothetical protein
MDRTRLGALSSYTHTQTPDRDSTHVMELYGEQTRQSVALENPSPVIFFLFSCAADA